jgi:hypothetical protein
MCSVAHATLFMNPSNLFVTMRSQQTIAPPTTFLVLKEIPQLIGVQKGGFLMVRQVWCEHIGFDTSSNKGIYIFSMGLPISILKLFFAQLDRVLICKTCDLW